MPFHYMSTKWTQSCSLQRSGRRPTCFLFLDNDHDGPLSDVSRIEKVIMPDVNEVVLPNLVVGSYSLAVF